MTEIDSTLTPFVEAEIKEHHAALMRQMVAVMIYHLCYVDIGGTASVMTWVAGADGFRRSCHYGDG